MAAKSVPMKTHGMPYVNPNIRTFLTKIRICRVYIHILPCKFRMRMGVYTYVSPQYMGARENCGRHERGGDGGREHGSEERPGVDPSPSMEYRMSTLHIRILGGGVRIKPLHIRISGGHKRIQNLHICILGRNVRILPRRTRERR